MHHRKYSITEKIGELSHVEAKMKEESISLVHAAEDLQVPVSLIYCWHADLAISSQTSTADQVKLRNHTVPEGFLNDNKEQFINFIMQWRDRGLPVTCFTVIQKATVLKPDFAEKSLPACFMCVSCFLHQNNLVHRITTHTSPKPHEAACKDARAYMQLGVPTQSVWVTRTAKTVPTTWTRQTSLMILA